MEDGGKSGCCILVTRYDSLCRLHVLPAQVEIILFLYRVPAKKHCGDEDVFVQSCRWLGVKPMKLTASRNDLFKYSKQSSSFLLHCLVFHPVSSSFELDAAVLRLRGGLVAAVSELEVKVCDPSLLDHVCLVGWASFRRLIHDLVHAMDMATAITQPSRVENRRWRVQNAVIILQEVCPFAFDADGNPEIVSADNTDYVLLRLLT